MKKQIKLFIGNRTPKSSLGLQIAIKLKLKQINAQQIHKLPVIIPTNS